MMKVKGWDVFRNADKYINLVVFLVVILKNLYFYITSFYLLLYARA